MKKTIEVGKQYLNLDGGQIYKITGKHVNSGEWLADVYVPVGVNEDDEDIYEYSYDTILHDYEITENRNMIEW